jgi:hypothetical protein
MYTCNRCSYSTDLKQSLIRHLEKKQICSSEKSDIDRYDQITILKNRNLNDSYCECNYCYKKFNNKSNMYTHRKNCKKSTKNNSLNDLKNKVEFLIKQNKDLENKINNTTPIIQNNTTPIIQNNTTNNNTQNININVPKIRDFGKENMVALPETLISTLFMDLRFKELLANLHCDPNYPENQNVRIKSIKRNTMEIFRNNKWDIMTFAKGLTELLLQGHKIFKDYYDKDKERILEEDMSEQEIKDVLNQLDQIERLNKEELRPLLMDLKMMLEEYRENGHAIIIV